MTYKGEVGNLYKTSYAWYSFGSSFGKPTTDKKKIRCAWCHKSQAEIKKTEDLNEHIEKHAKEDKE